MIVNLRFVKVSGALYLRTEDVANYIRELAATEETDVRNRLNEAAGNLLKREEDQKPLPPDASKRARRREKREKELGPERLILSRTSELAVLECGHHIHNPPIQETTHMRPPTHYRCGECRENHGNT